MKLIALGTVHGRKLVKEADPKDRRSKPKYQDLIAMPGDTFDTENFGIEDKEAADLISQKAAKRQTREIPVDGEAPAAPAAPAT